MTTEQRLSAILAANPGVLRRIDSILAGEIEGATDRRLLSIQQAADALGVSRTTIWRMLRDGGLPFVELRPGSRRIPSAAVTEFARRGATA
jgi:excisionase family DNA binding protein